VSRKKPPKETIWLVVYVFPHKQDVEVNPAKTKEVVPEVIGKLLLEIADEVKDTKVRALIRANIKGGQEMVALEAWRQWQTESANFPASIHIVEREVHVGNGTGKTRPVQEAKGSQVPDDAGGPRKEDPVRDGGGDQETV
jgi:hypothetical protein